MNSIMIFLGTKLGAALGGGLGGALILSFASKVLPSLLGKEENLLLTKLLSSNNPTAKAIALDAINLAKKDFPGDNSVALGVAALCKAVPALAPEQAALTSLLQSLDDTTQAALNSANPNPPAAS